MMISIPRTLSLLPRLLTKSPLQTDLSITSNLKRMVREAVQNDARAWIMPRVVEAADTDNISNLPNLLSYSKIYRNLREISALQNKTHKLYQGNSRSRKIA
jgi:hypothetical protein